MKGLTLTHHLVGMRSAIAAADVTVADLQSANVALEAENAMLRTRVADLERLDEARWAVEHTHWPDGRRIALAEQEAARATLRADRIARARIQQGGPHA